MKPITAKKVTKTPPIPNRMELFTPKFIIPARMTPPKINFDMSRQYLPYSCIINSRFFCFIALQRYKQMFKYPNI